MVGYERARQSSAQSTGTRAVKQHYVWLIWSSALLISWAVLYLARPPLRAVMWPPISRSRCSGSRS